MANRSVRPTDEYIIPIIAVDASKPI